MSYVEVCQKHGQHHTEICGECFDDLKEENARLREALKEIADQDYRGNRPTTIDIARAALKRE